VPPTAELALIVDFLLLADGRDRFLELVRDNAAQSVRDEPFCRRFDVIEPSDRPDAVLLYEIYADRAAFDAHLASDHYKRFDAATRELIVRKTVTFGHLTENTKR
jgi:quinol monooxygenase YgiN